MRVDLKVAVLFAVAGIIAGISLMAAPSAFPGLTSYAVAIFWISFIVFLPLFVLAIFLAVKNEGESPKTWHKRRMIALAFIVISVFSLIVSTAVYFWPSPMSPTSIAALSEDAVAHLSTLGWTIKPDTKSTLFQISETSLPDMEQSEKYFKQFAKPFNLQFQQVNSLTGLHYLASLTNCTGIQINAGQFTDLSELSDFIHIQNLGLSQLPLTGTDTVDTAPLARLVGLTNLNLNMVRTRSVASIIALTGIKSLNLGGTLITDVSPLSGFSNLESLDISQTRVTDLTPLAQDQPLKELTISGPQTSGLGALLALQNLKSLTIIEQSPLDLSAVGSLQRLENLSIIAGYFPLDLTPVGSLKNLHTLAIFGAPFGFLTAVTNPQAIGNLPSLHELTLSSLQIADLGFLSSLKNLTNIGLTNIPIESLSFLENLKLLQNVSLVNIRIIDVSPLLSLPALSALTLGRVPARSDVVSVLAQRGVAITSY